MTPNVIDIYHGDEIIDWKSIAAAGIWGVIHKCTQGAGYVDPLYAQRRKQAIDAGLLWGAYSFNTAEPVEKQVAVFLSHAEPDASTLLALDFEDNPHGQMSLSQAKEWLALVEQKVGRKPVLYSGNRVKDILDQHIDVPLSTHRLWLPQYGPVAHVQRSWTRPWLWQYSETGRVSGTRGNIDLNHYSGTQDQLRKEWAS